jgi:putative ABC transport system permease protein
MDQRRLHEWRAFRCLEETFRDIRYAGRTFRRDPKFAVGAALILAVAIASNAAIFTVVDALLLRPLPYPDAERLVALRSAHQDADTPGSGASSAQDLADWQEQAKSFQAIAGYRWRSVDLQGNGAGMPSQRLRGLYVTPEYFAVFGISPAAGRVFTSSDRGTNTIVLGAHLWRDRFGNDPRVIDSMLDVNMINLGRPGPTPNLVVGVARAGAHFPPLTADWNLGVGNEDDAIDFWLPEFAPRGSRDGRGMDVVAKLRPGVSVAQAQAEMDAISHHLAEAFPATNKAWRVDVVPLRALVIGHTYESIVLLSIATGFVLLIACGNVATLCLVRGLARSRELAVRSALGAGHGRLVRQLLTESTLIAAAAAVAGAVGAKVALTLLLPWFPPGIPFVRHISVDRTALAFVVALAAATALLAGVVPAIITMSRPFSATDLNLRGRAESRWHRRSVSVLTAVQAAATIVLLVSCGLLARSAQRLWKVNPGFNAAHVLTLTISLPANEYDWQHNVVFERDVIQAVRALPAVRDVAAIEGVPMRVGGFWTTFSVDGMSAEPVADHPAAHLRVISPGYFRTLQIPLLEGRDFDARDDVGARGRPRFVIVNRALATRYWPHESAIGKRLRQDYNNDWVTIAGVAGDVRYAGLDVPPDLEIYLPDGLFPESAMTLVVRTHGDPYEAAASVRSRIHDVDRDALVSDIHPMSSLISQSVAGRSFATLLITICAGVAVLLALSGVYGIVAEAAAQRRMEVGIRMALGGSAGGVATWMLRHTMQPIVTGTVLGILSAAATTRVFSTLLFDIGPQDPVTYTMMIGTFVLLATAAGFVPALRAARSDPLTVLRCD